jgi:outer membrane immunogenic protein
MKKLLLAAVALIALSSASSAADLPRKAPPAPPPPPAPVYDWNGFYIGVMGGYAWSDTVGITVGGVAFTTASSDLKGGFAGGTIGYNFAPVGSSWLLGIEADAAWADIKHSVTGTVLLPPLATLTFEDRIQALGSVTGRLGWTWGPGLLYVKGGWAWADNKVSATLATGGLVAPPVVLTASESRFHSGWTVGGGLEYLFAPNWSGKVEYMYADFGSATYVSTIGGGVGLSATVHTIKGGINYHFNWGGPGPVMAKY